MAGWPATWQQTTETPCMTKGQSKLKRNDTAVCLGRKAWFVAEDFFQGYHRNSRKEPQSPRALPAVSCLYVPVVIKFCLPPKCILDLALPIVSHCYHHSESSALDVETYTFLSSPDFLPLMHPGKGHRAHLPKLGLSVHWSHPINSGFQL
jgi:hypothetical protein